MTCNSGQHFAGNSELFPVSRHGFRNVSRLWHLAGNSFIVSCHVTMNKPMNGRANTLVDLKNHLDTTVYIFKRGDDHCFLC